MPVVNDLFVTVTLFRKDSVVMTSLFSEKKYLLISGLFVPDQISCPPG